MFRSSLYVAGALLLSASAFAQRDASAKLQPITSEVKHGGTYHVATKAWSRTATPTANLGPDTLYDNTCNIAFFVGLSSGETLVDSGRVPSTSSPTSGTSKTGDADSYTINGMQYGYCTAEAPTTDLNVSHITCYAPCDSAIGVPTVAAFVITGAPGSAAAGSQSCWIIDIDLEGTPDEFTLVADCDGAFSAAPASDNFGWTMLFTVNPINGPQGPFISGDPFGVLQGGPNMTGCPFGDGTKWGTAGSIEGTGIGTDDVFTSHDGATSSCWFFGGYLGGNPYSSFHHELYGDVGSGPAEPGSANCDADGITSSPCPCGNNNDGSAGVPAGCRNANNGAGGVLTATGSNSLGAQGTSPVVFTATNLDTSFCLFFQGNNLIGGGTGVAFGDGLRCAAQNVIRIQLVNAGANMTAVSTVNVASVGLVNANETKHYQGWYRNPNITLCGTQNFNLTNGYSITWAP
jgi:hypothetical protein